VVNRDCKSKTAISVISADNVKMSIVGAEVSENVKMSVVGVELPVQTVYQIGQKAKSP
jgi:hypothetical protein